MTAKSLRGASIAKVLIGNLNDEAISLSQATEVNQGDRGSGLSAMTNRLLTSNHPVISGLTRDLPLTLIY